jgi:hypothetical protein
LEEQAHELDAAHIRRVAKAHQAAMRAASYCLIAAGTAGFLPARRRHAALRLYAGRHLSRNQHPRRQRCLDLQRHEPPDIQNRIVVLHERQLASLVDNIERIEANSYDGVGVIKVYLNEGADVSRAVSQLASSALVVLKYMPRNITPPLVLRYGATDVPIIQLSVSSSSSDRHPPQRPRPEHHPPGPGRRAGRVRPLSLWRQAARDHGGSGQEGPAARGALSARDISDVLQRQNVILPSGDVKLGSKDYTVAMNNSPDLIETINNFPVKEVAARMVFMRDVAHVHDGYQIQTNSVSENGRPGALMMVRKTGGSSTLAVVDGIKAVLPDIAG